MRVARYLCCDLRCLIIPVVGIRHPRLSTVQALDRQLVLAVELREFILDVLDHERVYEFWCLVRDETVDKFSLAYTLLVGTVDKYSPYRELPGDLRWDHGLPTSSRECTFNTVQ